MQSQDFAQFPSLAHVLSALPAGALVSPSVVPFAAQVCGVGAPISVSALLASLPAGVCAMRVRVCPWACSCGRPAPCCRCPSLAVVFAASASPSCVLVWLAAPLPPSLAPAFCAVCSAAAASSAPVRIAVIGSRSFSALSLVSSFVAALPACVSVVSGAAAGVDRAAEDAARARGLPVVSLPAAWSSRGKRAGVMRNAEVVCQADVLVAFWDGVSPGTQDAIRRARRAGIPVFVVPPPPAPDAPIQPPLF